MTGRPGPEESVTRHASIVKGKEDGGSRFPGSLATHHQQFCTGKQTDRQAGLRGCGSAISAGITPALLLQKHAVRKRREQPRSTVQDCLDSTRAMEEEEEE